MNNYRIIRDIDFTASSMIVCWDEDVGGIGRGVFNYLNKKLGLNFFCEVEPVEFFNLGGVTVENDVAVFPECRFYYPSNKSLIIFKSSVPRYDWYKFISTVLDVAKNMCQVKEIFTIGGMVSMSAHTSPRLLMATVNSPESKLILSQYNVNVGMNYETPAGQRPTLNSYLIWEAMRRNVVGISLWVPIPFYMVSLDDIRAHRRVIEFINLKFGLDMDLADLDEALSLQNKNIMKIIERFPELMNIIRKLETNMAIDENETNMLVEIMEENLKQNKT